MDLLRQEYLEAGRPVVQLTPAGADVMSGKATLEDELPIPGELTRKIIGFSCSGGSDSSAIGVPQAQEASEPSNQLPMDSDLLARLKQWRSQRAEEARLPAYCILHNSMIEEIARHRPRTLQDLLALNGMGPKRVEQYGDELLAIVSGNRSHEERSDRTPGQQPSYYWTLRMLESGFTSDECAAARGISPQVVVDHALQAIENGHAVQAQWFFRGEKLARLQEVVGTADPKDLSLLLPMLPKGTRLEEVLLFRKCQPVH